MAGRRFENEFREGYEAMKPYLIANEITPVEVGERRDMLPLHCTLVHWFWLDEKMPIEELANTLTDIYSRRIRLIPDTETTFSAPTIGGDMPVRVTTVKRTSELIDLHERACAALVSLDAAYEKPEYIHEGYRPHITHQSGEIVDPRGYVSENLYVVTAERPEYGHLRTIVAKIALSR